MALPVISDIPNLEHLTYKHVALGRGLFFLDQLLDRMPPLAVLQGPRSEETMGLLSRLPAELMISVLEDLSISDLLRFRRCNRTANHYVDSKTLLRSAMFFAPNVLRGIMAIQPSESITAHGLQLKLRQRTCDGCGRLAQYFYLPSYSRACLECLGLNGSFYFYAPVHTKGARWKFFLEEAELTCVPSFRFIPSTWTNGLNKFRIQKAHRLYDYKLGMKAREEKYGEHTFTWPITDELCKEEIEFMGRDIAVDKQDASREEITVLDPSPEGVRLHMCVVFAPLVEDEYSQPEEGMLCSTCLGGYLEGRLYTRESMIEHLRECRVSWPLRFLWSNRNGYLTLLEETEL